MTQVLLRNALYMRHFHSTATLHDADYLAARVLIFLPVRSQV